MLGRTLLDNEGIVSPYAGENTGFQLLESCLNVYNVFVGDSGGISAARGGLFPCWTGHAPSLLLHSSHGLVASHDMGEAAAGQLQAQWHQED